MAELKTLKDLPLKYNGDICYKEDIGIIRKEAIKWIKYYKQQIYQLEHPSKKLIKMMATCTNSWEAYIINEKIEWIKNFFNITEEDFKMKNMFKASGEQRRKLRKEEIIKTIKRKKQKQKDYDRLLFKLGIKEKDHTRIYRRKIDKNNEIWLIVK